MRVLNIGSLNIDYVYNVRHIVKPGETISSSDLGVYPGGKGANQSVALAKAGANVFHAGIIGNDGQFLIDLLKKNKVDTSNILIGKNRTGNAIIQVSETGENSIVLYGGSNLEFSKENVNTFLNNFGPEDYLLLQNEINNIAYIIKQASKKGIKIIFNPAPITDSINEYPLHLLDTIILNEIEGSQLCGKNGLPENVLNSLTEKFPEVEIILTLGEKGVLYKSGDMYLKQEAYPVPVVDTTAAGDTFIGFFLSSKINKNPIQECLEIGCRAASIAISKMGATNSIPYLSDLKK